MENLPPFRDQGRHSPSLLVGIQALIPAYNFTCNATVTRWGLSIEKKGQHRIDLQVWRPLEDLLGSYHLVGANTFNVKPQTGQKLLYLLPDVMDQIQVQPGDVVGLYIENNASVDDDYAIQYVPNVNGVTVHYKQTDQPLDMIQSYTMLPVQFPNIAPVMMVETGELY